MKRKVIGGLVLAVVMMAGVLGVVRANVNLKELVVGEPFTVEYLDLGDQMYVIDLKDADVTGDEVTDQVILVGKKIFSPEDIFADQLTIVVQDGVSKKYSTITDEQFSGYEGRLMINDFTGDQIADVMVTASTGGSGGIVNHMIATFAGSDSKLIFAELENMGVRMVGEFVDGYQAELRVKNIANVDQIVTIDLQDRKDMYIEQAIYSANGQLLKEIQPIVYPFSRLEAIDVDFDGVYELRGTQRIVGAYGADGIGFVESLWKYEDGKWQAKNLMIYKMLDYIHIQG